MQAVSKVRVERKPRPATGVGSGRDCLKRRKGSKTVDQLLDDMERRLPKLKKLLNRA